MGKVVFRGDRVVLPSGVAPAQVLVHDGRIAAVDPLGTPRGSDTPMVDVGDAILLPGLVDTHVHVNEPGRTEWEGFATATRAAAAGGVTTILDMPLNSVPATTTPAALAAKRSAAVDQCHVDVGFIGGIVPTNEVDLTDLQASGIFAWKCFLTDSGVPEFHAVTSAFVERVAPLLARLGLPLMVHAELPERLVALTAKAPVRRYREYAATRPATAEAEAVARMIDVSRMTGVHIHIVHVSSAESATRIAAARANGVRITAETCPHYLTFTADDIPDGATEFKCAPPIRSRDEREALWRALHEGALQMVVSDHSPAPPALKATEQGDFAAAWGGIASIELGLAAVVTGATQRAVELADVVQWMATGPADLVRLADKGRIAEGCDADLVIWQPGAEWSVDARRLHQRHALTPYHGLTLAGRVRATYLRGQLIYEDGAFGVPSGRLLARPSA